MNVLFLPLLVIHVVVAVLGLGSLLSIAVVASTARRAGRESADVATWLRTLLRGSAVSLAIMLATGLLMDVVRGGALHAWWWFRASVFLLLATGALHARARRLVREGLVRGRSEAVLGRVERIAYGMCVLVAAITVLMEAKPF